MAGGIGGWYQHALLCAQHHMQNSVHNMGLQVLSSIRGVYACPGMQGVVRDLEAAVRERKDAISRAAEAGNAAGRAAQQAEAAHEELSTRAGGRARRGQGGRRDPGGPGMPLRTKLIKTLSINSKMHITGMPLKGQLMLSEACTPAGWPGCT